ncbi:MAG: threonine-phosphate decarboxylase [SAR86 cluster bacterium]|uniref:Aminotransferase n=1 Tax=SAR86 cluster bacterium TaxID=2030880 RepID=A0A2A4MHR2_9GAMM|nr:MAG: threonine-phosphate decarboxylase [SAR86 cluster bacterium]
MFNHGGNLQRARQAYPQVKTWLDLSTGISPWVWPVPQIPAEIWQQLPQISAGFEASLESYYGVDKLIPVAGSQTAIALLPQLLPLGSVALPQWGYAEHRLAWQLCGHQLYYYKDIIELEQLLLRVDHAVVINPNNPTGQFIPPDQLIALQGKIKGYLIIDEAFIDVMEIMDGDKSQFSVLDRVQYGSLIVLRSMGKFFGIAGARLGFVALPNELINAFKAKQILWSIATPSLWLAEQALNDRQWQRLQGQRIISARTALFAQLQRIFNTHKLSQGPLFISVYDDVDLLNKVFSSFAKVGIWLRIFQPIGGQTSSYLRIGLTSDVSKVDRAISHFLDTDHRTFT